MLFPAEGAQQSLQPLLASFERWADQHAGADRGVMREQGRTIPFFDSQSAAQLVAEIRRGARRPDDAAAAPAHRALVDAQLFLAMAQKFDRQQADLAREIEALAAKEKQLLALLKGEDEWSPARPLSSWAATSPEPMAMLDMRLRAWGLLMAAADPALPEEVLFLTVGKDVVDQLRELFPASRYHQRSCAPQEATASVRDGHDQPVWLTRGLPADDPQTISVALGEDAGFDLLEIPATAPGAFLHRLAAGPRGSVAPPSSKALPFSTWIGSLTPCGESYEYI
jgi:hypothetical protein